MLYGLIRPPPTLHLIGSIIILLFYITGGNVKVQKEALKLLLYLLCVQPKLCQRPVLLVLSI